MTDERPAPIGLRRVPQQARSRARVDAVVAAFFELVAESDLASELTIADMSARSGVSLGSIYEYFEDLPSIADVAMGRVLDRHDELLAEVGSQLPRTLKQLVDVLFDAYYQLYSEDPGFLAFRRSSLFQVHHRTWLADRVAAFVRTVADQATSMGVFVRRPDTVARLDFVFVMGDAILQAALADGAPGDEMILEEGRAVLHYAVRRVMNALDTDD